jgi:hypothetical protein
MLKRLICILCVLSSEAFAQAPTPSQTAIQIDTVINQWAQTIEAQQKIIADLQKQLEDSKNPPKPDANK